MMIAADVDSSGSVDEYTNADAWKGPGASDTADTALYLEIDGWEGPLDLLLDLARRQKVDLRGISILELVDQYLTYIDRAEALRLELAADYLVMAAWLAFLKSALLLPREEQEDPGPEELALRLQMRLARLGAMREAAARVMARDRLGPRCFPRAANPKGCASTGAVAGSANGSILSRPMALSGSAPNLSSTWCANAW